MRTTVTLDDALFKELKKIAHRDGISMKLAVNRALQLGIANMERTPRRRTYRAPTFAMGEPKVPSLDKSLALASALEDEEVARELALRK
jgi:hypothetical protein